MPLSAPDVMGPIRLSICASVDSQACQIYARGCHVVRYSLVQSTNSRSCCVAPASHKARPALPEMSPSPIVPFLTSVPSGHVPSAVVAKVCVNATATPTVLPPIVWMDVTCVTVGACVGASAATGPPPPAAAWAEAREKRGRSRRRAARCIIASEARDKAVEGWKKKLCREHRSILRWNKAMHSTRGLRSFRPGS